MKPPLLYIHSLGTVQQFGNMVSRLYIECGIFRHKTSLPLSATLHSIGYIERIDKQFFVKFCVFAGFLHSL